MRASTFYQQTDYQPGTQPTVISIANQEDLRAAEDDVKRARALADVVVVSFHWGIHHVRGVLAMYQREVAHAVIDAGADLIIGHHPHVLKGIEVYRGKVVFYSMGNFAFDCPHTVRLERQKAAGVKKSSHSVDPEYAEYYSWGKESRKSMIVRCEISNKKISQAAFLPVEINRKAQPVVLTGDDEVLDALEDMRDLCTTVDLNTELSVQNGEIVIAT
jgi:poly-gamma-glutamate synthesis protein (capsule biosynthesis protein)